MEVLIMVLMFLTSIFLILLVLVQRGRGGGLAGALGGMGGQSAFGTKAGDLFTRITIGVASVWILLCIFALKYFSTSNSESFGAGLGAAKQTSTTPEGAVEGSEQAKSAPASTEKGSGTAEPALPASPAEGASSAKATSAGNSTSGSSAKSESAPAKK